MSGSEFFRMIAVTGMGLLGLTALMGIMRKRTAWDAAERAEMWLSLEVGLAVVLFALLPYPLTYIGSDEAFAWRFGSLVLVAYLIWHMIRIGLNQHRYGAQYPVVMGLLLVLSGIFSTMEFVNAVWWGSLAGYTCGVLWLLALTGIQLIAFVCYDRQTQIHLQVHPQAAVVYYPPAAHDRIGGLRGDHRTGDSNRPPDAHAHDYSASHRATADHYRYRDDRQIDAYRRSITDSTVRSRPAVIEQQRPNSLPRS